MSAVVLTLDAALDGCSAGVVRDGVLVAEARQGGGRGSAAVLPDLARAVLAQAGVAAPALRMIAVTVGPGSFTGVRAALALAQGIGLAAGVAVVGVTVGAAIRAGLSEPAWVAVDSRRERVFLDIDGVVASVAVAALPAPEGPVAVAGDAAAVVVAALVARGFEGRVVGAVAPGAVGIALGAARAGCPAVPLYVDPVEARPPAVLRPAPV